MRRTYRYAVAVATLATAVTGCSTQHSTSGGGSGAAAAEPLVMTAGGGPTFTRDFNIFAPATVSQTPGSTLVYEPLLATDRSDAGSFKPWLATSYAWGDGGKTLTFKLRKGVTWSDGKPFTSADVKYTFDLYLSGKVPMSAPFKSVSAPDAHTVVIHYSQSSYADLASFASGRLIVPQHIWKLQNPKTWTNPNPVGTGPFTVTKFSPQSVSFSIRKDYWGGKSKGLKEVQVVSSANPAALQSRMKQNKQDWGTVGWPNVQKDFVAKDPAHHKFNFYPTGGVDGITFNTNVAPYNDVHVRRALRDAVDPQQVAKVVGVGFSAPSVVGVDPHVYASQLTPKFAKPMTADVAKAKAELAAGGWTVKGGDLVKGGKAYPLTYNVYQPYAEWVTSGQVMADQWKKALGLNVSVHQMGDQPFTQADSTGHFGMDSGSPTLNGSIYGVYSMYLKENYKAIGQEATTNTGRWKDPKFQSLMQQYIALPPTETAKRRTVGQKIQDEIYQQAPFIPVATSGWKAELVTSHWTNWPKVGASFVPNGTLAPDAIETLMHVTPAS